MSDQPNENQDILESVLDQAFSAPPRVVTESPANQNEGPKAVEEPYTVRSEQPQELTASTTSELESSWKAEYEAQVQSWRARSAEEREKAEKERLRWEAIRAIEKGVAAKRKAAGIPDEENSAAAPPQLQVEENWENVKVPLDSTPAESTGVALTMEDSASLTLESTRPEPSSTLPRTHSQENITDESQKWENVASVTSSYPSLSFPEHVETPPRPQPTPPRAPISVTLSVFDSSLSTRTRVTAFFSSLAVNLLLPFVNGVMLGFGEIFAKNVVMGWFGWKSSVANVGVKSSSRRK